MKNNEFQCSLPLISGCKTEFHFDTPNSTTDAGVLILAAVEKRVGIIRRIADAIVDPRNQKKITHSQETLLAQRVYQIAMGYEDTNDADALRKDSAFLNAAGKHPLEEEELSSQPTQNRLENRVTISDLLRISDVFLDIYTESFDTAPKSIIIDMDPTAVHNFGDQQLTFFNGYEDEYCMMPFHVYDGVSGKIITTLIRPGKTPSDTEILWVLNRIVKKLKAAFPKTTLVFRADGHHSKPRVFKWLETRKIHYVVGLPTNPKLVKQFDHVAKRALSLFEKTGVPQRCFASGKYAAGSWEKTYRRVVCRAIVDQQGRVDLRFVVTSLGDFGATKLYENLYCQRGNCERFIKEHKNDLQSDRLSCNKATANQFRLFLHSAAYVLMHELRSNFLKGSELAAAQFGTIRLKLLKAAASAEIKKRKIIFHLPVHFPLKSLFENVVERLQPLKV